MATGGGDLPPEMICCIAEQADVGCRARMRAVCSLWRALVPVDLPQPWVLLQPAAAAAAAGDLESDRFRMLSLPANRELTLSRAFTSGCGVAGARCVGAGHGWLALVGADLSVTLHNPFTGRSVSLPPLANHPMVKRGVRDDGTVLRRRALNDDTNLDAVTAENLRDNLVRKIVFSPAPEQDGCFAVQKVASDENTPPYAMYARAGAKQWKTLRGKDEEPIMVVSDVLHVEGSRFFFVEQYTGAVYQLDLAAQGGVDDGHGDQDEVGVNDEDDEDAFVYSASNDEEDDYDPYPPSLSLLAPSLYQRWPSYPREGLEVVANYLVFVDGELYQVWAKWDDEPAPAPEVADAEYRIIEQVGVVKCDLVEHRWMEVGRELDDWAVLVGANETVAVRAGDMPGLRGNCIYFIHGYLEKTACAFDVRTQRAKAVNSEMLRRVWPWGPWRYRSPQPVWFAPSSYADAVAEGGSSRPPSCSCPPEPEGRHDEPAQRSGVVSSEPTARVLKTRMSSGYTIMNQSATLMIN